MKLLISIATRIIPRHYLQHVSHFFLRIFSLFLRGNKFEDPINGKTYRKLLPYGRLKPRENAIAPDSLSLERHRLMWLFLKNKTNFFTDNLKFLHIAPEYCFIKIFKGMKNLDYLILDCLWINNHPSHFNLEQSIKLINKLKPKKNFFFFFLFLLSLLNKNEKIPFKADFFLFGIFGGAVTSTKGLLLVKV